MKVAVIKLGARISFNANDTSGGNGEARSIIKILETAGVDVHIYTKILKKDDLIQPYKWHNIAEDHEATADTLLVLNGNVNFFGGAEDPEQILNYKMINHFKGPVFYAYCDPSLTLKQLWPSVQKKPWGGNWTERDLNITRNDIVYLSQPHDVGKVKALLGKNCIIPQRIQHFPFERFPCLNPQLPMSETYDVDLSYGGTMRGGKRIEKMVKFYFDHPEEISVEMFGKIESGDFVEHPKIGARVQSLRAPLFTGPVKYADMLPKMNRSLSHVVIGDPLYEEINDMAQRAFESIWSNVVTFIDHDLDSLRRVYGADKELADFLYVKERQEVSEKIMLLKKDSTLRKEILESQIKVIDFDAQRYAHSLVDIMQDGL